MSLVVINDEGLFADRRISVDLACDQQVWTQDQKLFLSPDGTVGFGVAGQINSNDNLFSALSLLRIYSHHYVNKNISGLKDVKVELDAFRDSLSEITVYVITKEKSFVFTGGNLSSITAVVSRELVMGTGASVYMMLKNNDIPIRQALQKTAEKIKTVGPVFDHISRQSLLPIKPPQLFAPLKHQSFKNKLKDKKVRHAQRVPSSVCTG